MSNKTLIIMLATLLTVAISFAGCTPGQPVTEMRTLASVERGDLEVKVSVYGYIETRPAVNAYFDTTMFTPPYSARIDKVYVERGDMVKAGTILAKLDDTTERMAVESAQYALELAINNVVQTVCCGVTRAPSFYSDAVALLRYEAAMKEVQETPSLLADSKFEDAASQIALAKYDLEGAKKIYIDPEFINLRTELKDLSLPELVTSSKDANTAIGKLTSEIDNLSAIQEQIRDGKYDELKQMLDSLSTDMSTTHLVIKRLNHLQVDYTCPDTCTTFTVINEALTELAEVKQEASTGNFDALTLSEAIHDLELGNKILQENVTTFRQGLNLNAERVYNINIQTALISLDRTKQALLKTELIAPFDAQVVDVNLYEGDMITQRYSATGLPIDTYVLKLADNREVKMIGTANEMDAAKLLKGQKASVFIDAFPGKVFSGEVRFISPYGTLQTGTATYEIEIELDPNDAAYLTGQLTATAVITVDTHKDVLLIPNSALHTQGTESWVYIINDQARMIEQRQVQVGLQSQTETEILSGLKEGEKVLLGNSTVPAKSLNSAAPD